ncbi:hypothetical protein Leryth_023836 [Lithospermum erythrorhizon]|nr:hypothetical protein Leryth_023836 [Lithospermum erythrorhizon]
MVVFELGKVLNQSPDVVRSRHTNLENTTRKKGISMVDAKGTHRYCGIYDGLTTKIARRNF